MSPSDLVVCINDDFPPWVKHLYTQLPNQGQCYTIRDVRLGIQPDGETGDISVLLEGIVNPKANSKAALERGFSESRFKAIRQQGYNKIECDFSDPTAQNKSWSSSPA